MINYACRYYKGAKPCVFNKTDDSECPSCTHASEFRERVLFIKLDAVGDVLRSASLLPIICARHEAPYIAWLTRKELVELVSMMVHVDEVIELSEAGLARVMVGGWDYAYSLSNDLPSASIATATPVKQRRIGYTIQMASSNRAMRPPSVGWRWRPSIGSSGKTARPTNSGCWRSSAVRVRSHRQLSRSKTASRVCCGRACSRPVRR